ncbi:MAG: hypothetical protein EB832_03965, partial [Thaumarchaeota archaeon S14]
ALWTRGRELWGAGCWALAAGLKANPAFLVLLPLFRGRWRAAGIFAAALAALLRRERSGTGAHAQVSQVEAVIGILGDLLLKEGLAGGVQPLGNRSERGAPWGAYPCAGDDQWCVICVRGDGDWRALRGALGDPAGPSPAPLWVRPPPHDTLLCRAGLRHV